MNSEKFFQQLLQNGFQVWTGVPCSFLTPLINSAIRHADVDYLPAANEGEAIGIASGARLAGKKSVVMMQNSGLGNAVNPLATLCAPFEIPLLLLITHRGDPDLCDEPQHALMGRRTISLLENLEIPAFSFSGEESTLEQALEKSSDHRGPVALVIKKGAIETSDDSPLPEIGKRESNSNASGDFGLPIEKRMSRSEAIEVIELAAQNQAVIASTGHIGRELYRLGPKPNHFYMAGSMGCASAIGLGIKAARPHQPVCVLDGDGSVLMRLENLTTIGHHGPKNFYHFIIDNEVHQSTGGQPTVSASIDFSQIALSCGYQSAIRIENPSHLRDLCQSLQALDSPTLIHVKVKKGSEHKLPRPEESFPSLRKTFSDWIRSNEETL